jgi:3D (Asp-Asp-Asp) domain-containing protein
LEQREHMKKLITTMILSPLLVCIASAAREQTVVTTATKTVRKETIKPRSLLARVTVYWAGGRGTDRYTRQHKSSTGLRLKTGHCAVDPRRIPYGSQVIFPDRTGLTAVDTGSAVRSRKAARRGGRTAFEKSAIVVDRFFETKGQALAWERKNPAFMTVQVMPPTYRQQTIAQPVLQPTSSPRFAASTNIATIASQPATAQPIAQAKPSFQSADMHGPLSRASR